MRAFQASAGVFSRLAFAVEAVSCWGDVSMGSAPLGPLLGVAVGSRHACVRLIDTGNVESRGDNDAGQLGDGSHWSTGPVEPFGQP